MTREEVRKVVDFMLKHTYTLPDWKIVPRHPDGLLPRSAEHLEKRIDFLTDEIMKRDL